MHSKLGVFFAPFALSLMFLSNSAISQEEAQAPAVAEPILTPVEDTTLDASNEAAAAAANSVPNPSQEAVQNPTTDTTTPASQVVEEPKTAKETTSENPENEDEEEKREASTLEQTPQPSKPENSAPNSQTVSDSKVADRNSNKDSSVKGIYGGRVFGRYRMQIAGNRPVFDEGQKCYDKLYGKPQTYFSMTADWFPLDWWINPGITMRMGSYSARGKAVSGSSQGAQVTSCDQLTLDNNSKTTLLFMPLQLGAKIQITPFSRKWLVVDVWGAGEYGWWQETRDSASAAIAPFNLLAASQTYTNTGRKPAVSSGASVHLLLNYLDEQTVRSMMDSMGIGYVYLSGFAERVKSRTMTGLTFGRQVVGVGFTFETYK